MTPSHSGAGMTLSGGGNPGDPSQHNGGGLMDPNASMDDIPDLSIAVTEIGVIPPPPMFSSPSPPLPPPPPLTSNQVTNGHVIVNHQVFHTNITVDGQTTMVMNKLVVMLSQTLPLGLSCQVNTYFLAFFYEIWYFWRFLPFRLPSLAICGHFCQPL